MVQLLPGEVVGNVLHHLQLLGVGQVSRRGAVPWRREKGGKTRKIFQQLHKENTVSTEMCTWTPKRRMNCPTHEWVNFTVFSYSGRLRFTYPNPNLNPADPHVFGPPGSGSGSISQRYGSGSGSGSFYHWAKIVRNPWFLLFCDFFLTFYLWKMI